MKTRFYCFSEKGRIKRYKKKSKIPFIDKIEPKMVIEIIERLNEKENIHFFNTNFGKQYQVWIANNPSPSNQSLFIARSFLMIRKDKINDKTYF